MYRFMALFDLSVCLYCLQDDIGPIELIDNDRGGIVWFLNNNAKVVF